VSPDGRALAYTVIAEDGESTLHIRAFDVLEPRAVSGTVGASMDGSRGRDPSNIRPVRRGVLGGWLRALTRWSEHLRDSPGSRTRRNGFVASGCCPRSRYDPVNVGWAWSSVSRRICRWPSEISGADVLRVGAPRGLFTLPFDATYQAQRDRNRFVISSPLPEQQRPAIQIVLNWN
jgi:hypothetical protein